MTGIYKITDITNGKVYIGQSINIENRIKQHFNGHGKIAIDLEINSKGSENFSVEILEECPTVELNRREQFYIKKYNSVENGYNCNYGTNKDKKLKYIKNNSSFIYNDKTHPLLKKIIIAIHKKLSSDCIVLNVEDFREAAINLTPSALKLYLFFSEKQNLQSFLLFPKSIQEAYGISESTYRRAKAELIKKGYLIQKGKEVHFYADKNDAPSEMSIERYKEKINHLGKELIKLGFERETILNKIKSIKNFESKDEKEQLQAYKEIYDFLQKEFDKQNIDLI